jgi:hypothetical protein
MSTRFNAGRRAGLFRMVVAFLVALLLGSDLGSAACRQQNRTHRTEKPARTLISRLGTGPAS